MSRARDMANLGLQAGSGLDASDITTGTLGAVTLGASVVFPAGGTGNPISVAIIADEKAWNAASGAFTNGAWRRRTFNTVIRDPDNIVSIVTSGSYANQQFTLIAGTYLIEWFCPAYRVNHHSTVLYDVTAGDYISGAMGSGAYTDAADSTSTISNGFYELTISSANTYEIRHRCYTTKTSNGLGIDQNTDSSSWSKSIYAIAKFTKIK